MRKIFFIIACLSVQYGFSQQPYYNDVDLSLTGQDLYNALQVKINIASNTYTYGDVRNDFKIMDENPDDTNTVLLIYGYNDSDGSCITDRKRDKDFFGGNSCDFNREHVFARSLANPGMGDADNNASGIVADPHNLRPSDVQQNGNRGNKKFGDGSGNAGNVGSGNWYPGDEWKGDVARMMMYMYTRYGDRCLPSLVGVSDTQGNTEMLQLFLQWNADDPVSELEQQRNPHLEMVYGNRNPFIDNPVLATIIWGGPEAEDLWGLLNTSENVVYNVSLYPNPASETIYVQSTTSFQPESYIIYSLQGKKIAEKTLNISEKKIDISTFQSGVYLLELCGPTGKQLKKIIIE
ncbi:endonuclease [Cochleicola gelatinilyticus]|nr:endonuclease [Cochleicola gelatinilyticus]